jgi:hypothetical protein
MSLTDFLLSTIHTTKDTQFFFDRIKMSFLISYKLNEYKIIPSCSPRIRPIKSRGAGFFVKVIPPLLPAVCKGNGILSNTCYHYNENFSTLILY